MAKEAKKEEGKTEKKERRPQAQKRDLQNAKRRLRNRSFSAQVKTAVRQYDEVVNNGDSAKKEELLRQVYSLMDKGVKKGIFKANKASRTKSRLATRAK